MRQLSSRVAHVIAKNGKGLCCNGGCKNVFEPIRFCALGYYCRCCRISRVRFFLALNMSDDGRSDESIRKDRDVQRKTRANRQRIARRYWKSVNAQETFARVMKESGYLHRDGGSHDRLDNA